MYLSNKVVNYSHKRQHPQYGKINNPDLDRGDFIFVPSKMREQATRIGEKPRRIEEKARREAAEIKALEEELKRLKAEQQKNTLKQRDIPHKPDQERRLAYIPKEVKDAEIQRIKLRSVPNTNLWESDVENLIRRRNFFHKYKNERGDFPNDFVDNGDGTITDRVTGLMWEKGGSQSELLYYQAKSYISRLNKERFAGYDDWRIPTIEELLSLLERNVKDGALFIDSRFNENQAECWSSDSYQSGYVSALTTLGFTLDFSTGMYRSKIIESGNLELSAPVPKYVRAVRNME